MENKYPVKNTAFPTKFDNEIDRLANNLRNTNDFSWDKTQQAPSELSFKISALKYVMGYAMAEQRSLEIDGITPHDEICRLENEPRITLADLEWLRDYARARNSPEVVKYKKLIEAFNANK